MYLTPLLKIFTLINKKDNNYNDFILHILPLRPIECMTDLLLLNINNDWFD